MFRKNNFWQIVSPLTSQKIYYGHGRLLFIVIIFGCMALLSMGRLVSYCFFNNLSNSPKELTQDVAARPDIIDRNGRLLATDIRTYSLYADPRQIFDPNETVELLVGALPQLNTRDTYNKLTSHSAFVWIERGLSPQKRQEILNLGIPGLGFRSEIRRFYPAGNITSHVVGLVDIDNYGIAGIEKYIDQNGLSVLRANGLVNQKNLKPLRLSLDLRVQTIVHEVVDTALKKYKAIAAGAVVLNIHTGEVISLVSVPDYDPNKPSQAFQPDKLNRISAGVYEMGSTMKSFTTAMALDSNKFNLNSLFDASEPIRFGNQTIHDYHGKNRILKLWEVFIYSSNIGSVREVQALGIPYQEEFLKRLGILDRLQTELPESASPIFPRVWKPVNSATIAFGHGLATTPLQTAAGDAALLNGGYWIKPTFLVQSASKAQETAKRVVQTSTSDKMRYLDWLNGNLGSGRLARVWGYRVGGKTGTAEKVVNGKYSNNVRFNAYLAAFPIEAPQYVVLTIIDEPKKVAPDPSATAAFNAGRMAGDIIRRAAFYLGVSPDPSKEGRPPFLTEEEKPK